MRKRNKVLLWIGGIIGGIFILGLFDYQTAFMLGFVSVPILIFFLIFNLGYKLLDKLFKKFFQHEKNENTELK